MVHEVEPASIWSESSWRVVIWLLLIGAFSPVLLDLVSHIEAHAWTRTTLVFPWLAWVAARSNPEKRTEPSTVGIWCALVFALVFEIVAVSGDAPRMARVGFAVGLVGLVWGARWAGLGPALLLLWMIPVPTFLLEILSPSLERLWGTLGTGLLAGVDLTVVGRSPALRGPSGAQAILEPAHGGLALLVALAGIGWFQAVTRGVSGAAAFVIALRWCAVWVPTQLMIVFLASGSLAVGTQKDPAEMILNHSGWILILALGLILSVPLLRSHERVQEDGLSC